VTISDFCVDEADVRWPDNAELNKIHSLNALEDNFNIKTNLCFLAKKLRRWVVFLGGRQGSFTKH